MTRAACLTVMTMSDVDHMPFYEEAYEKSLQELWLNPELCTNPDDQLVLESLALESPKRQQESVSTNPTNSYLGCVLNCIRMLCCNQTALLPHFYSQTQPEDRHALDDYLEEEESQDEPWSPTSIPVLSPPGFPSRIDPLPRWHHQATC